MAEPATPVHDVTCHHGHWFDVRYSGMAVWVQSWECADGCFMRPETVDRDYAALAGVTSEPVVNEKRYQTDPVYHAIVHRLGLVTKEETHHG